MIEKERIEKILYKVHELRGMILRAMSEEPESIALFEVNMGRSVHDILVDLERIEEGCRSALEMYKIKTGDIFIVEEMTDEGMVAKELRSEDEVNDMIQFAERNGDRFWKGVKLGLLWLLRKEVIDYKEYYRR